MNKRIAFWMTAVAGLVWIGIGSRDVFAPYLLNFDGRVPTNTNIFIDFVVGALLLVAALSLRTIKSSGA